MSNFWIIRGPEEVSERLGFLGEHLEDRGVWPIRLDIKKHTNPRSLSHNNLFWMWMADIAAYLNKRSANRLTKDDVHDLVCHKFLGYQRKTIAGTDIEVLRGTSKLDSGEFGYFMEQIDAWACDLGVMLKYPKASEYAEYKEAQNG